MLENEAISSILKKIYDKWSIEFSQTNTESTEKVSIYPEASKEEDTLLMPPKKDAEAPPETVIISRKGIAEASEVSPGKQDEITEEIPPETVVLSRGDIDISGTPPERQMKDTAEVPPETVVISRQGIKDSSGLSKGINSKNRESESAGEKIKKTEEEDFLTETVILKPLKVKNKNKNGKE